jgi:hypothetical protein
MRKIRVTPQPPPFEMQPWFPLIVRLLNPGVSINVVSIQNAIATQLQEDPASFVVEFRLQSARFWGALATPGTMVPLTVRFFDPLSIQSIAATASSDTAMVIQDYPDVVNRARVGFKYSKAQQNHTIGSTIGSSSVVFTTTGMGTNSVAYISLLWRPRDTVAPTIQEEELDEEEQQVYETLCRLENADLSTDDSGTIRTGMSFRREGSLEREARRIVALTAMMKK